MGKKKMTLKKDFKDFADVLLLSSPALLYVLVSSDGMTTVSYLYMLGMMFAMFKTKKEEDEITVKLNR